MDRANKPTDRKMAARESESPKSIENNPALTLVSASPFISNIRGGKLVQVYKFDVITGDFFTARDKGKWEFIARRESNEPDA